MPETKEVTSQISSLSKATAKNGKTFYKLQLVGYDMTLFCFDTKLIDSQDIAEGHTIKAAYLPGDYPKIERVEKLPEQVQTTVNGKVEHTTRPMPSRYTPNDKAQMARSTAVKVAFKELGLLGNTIGSKVDTAFILAKDIEMFILQGKVPENWNDPEG